MAPMTNQVATMFDMLTEREQLLIYELVQRLIPDDIATADDIAAHAVAQAEHARGETVSMDKIDWS